jgi:hypothetical protein
VSCDLSSREGVSAQFAMWGYAITGDILERSAVIAEAKNVSIVYPGAWDEPGSKLAGSMIAKGGEYRRVKDWAALPWVGEHMLRGHEPWAGL